jgi:TatD DNase family protein
VIDSHCHLAGSEFEADLEAVIDRARAAGLRGALVILSAGDRDEAGRAGRVHRLWPEVTFSVGIHPHQAGEHADLAAAVSLVGAELAERSAVALGEIGLDYHYDFSPRDVQQEIFRRQLRLARERQLPVIIHTREAEDDTFQILSEEADGLRVVFHCFTGTTEMARRVLDLGGWLSFAGILTFPKASELREVGRLVPVDRMLVETDSPYLAPVPYRGKRNEPAFVVKVIETLAELRGESVASVGERVRENFAAVFGRPGRSALHRSLLETA